jgi:hypothetical protein
MVPWRLRSALDVIIATMLSQHLGVISIAKIAVFATMPLGLFALVLAPVVTIVWGVFRIAVSAVVAVVVVVIVVVAEKTVQRYTAARVLVVTIPGRVVVVVRAVTARRTENQQD